MTAILRPDAVALLQRLYGASLRPSVSPGPRALGIVVVALLHLLLLSVGEAGGDMAPPLLPQAELTRPSLHLLPRPRISPPRSAPVVARPKPAVVRIPVPEVAREEIPEVPEAPPAEEAAPAEGVAAGPDLAPSLGAGPPAPMGGPTSAAVLRHSIKPVFPRAALRMGLTEVLVEVAIIVGADGRVKEVRYLDGPPMFEDTVKEAVQRWRFQPALLDGEPVASEFRQRFLFRAR